MNHAAPLGAVFRSYASALRVLALWSTARPRLALCAVAALAAASAAFAATHLRVNTDSSQLIASHLPHRQREVAINQAFPSLTEDMIVIVDAPSADAAEAFSARLVSAIRARPDALREPFAPALDPFFAHNGLLFMKDADLDLTLSRVSRAAPVLGALAADPGLSTFFGGLAQGVREADQLAGGEAALTAALGQTTDVINARLAGAPTPLAWSRLLSGADASEPVRRIISVRPVLDFANLAPADNAINALRAAIAHARRAPGLETISAEITGEPALRGEELSSVTRGLALSFVISFLSVGVILWLSYGRVVQALLSLAIVGVTLCWAAGFAALVFPALNLVSMAFAVLLVGLGADYAIHVLLRAEEARARGAETHAAVDEAVSELAEPLGLCAVTTAIGFAAFIATDFVGMAQLGLIGAFGVFGALFSAMIIAPAGLALWRPAPRLRPAGEALFAPLRTRLAPIWPATRWAVLALVCGAALTLPFARFETDPMALRDPNASSVVAFNRLFADDDTRPYRASVLAPDLAAADAIAARARALPGIASAVTLSQFAPAEAFDRAMLIDAVAIGLLPQLEAPSGHGARANGLAQLQDALGAHPRPGGAEMAAALARLKAAAATDAHIMDALEDDVLFYWPTQLARLKDMLAPDPDLNLEAVPAAIRQSFLAPDGRARVEITPVEDLRDAHARAVFVRTLSRAIPEAAAGPVSIDRAGAVVAKAMVIATGAALALITLLVFAAWGDSARAISVLGPLFGAAMLTIGLTVVLGMPFNYANVIALPMLLGAGVDSAIHVTARTRAIGGAGAMFGTSTPRAVVFSALTTIASFGSLTVSAHRGVASIGALLMIALTATILCTLALQPLVDRFVRGRPS